MRANDRADERMAQYSTRLTLLSTTSSSSPLQNDINSAIRILGPSLVCSLVQWHRSFFRSLHSLCCAYPRGRCAHITYTCSDASICQFCGLFLDAFSHLYKRVCPSVGPSVRPSVHPSVGPSVTHELKPCKITVFDQIYWQYERERILCHVSALVPNMIHY